MTGQTMKAIVVSGAGGAEVLHLADAPRPEPRGRELLIKVAAAGVNRPDVLQRQGAYPPPPGAPDILGLEISGEIAARGPDASRYRVGETVLALVPGGGYAQYCLADERNALPIPAGLSMIEAAAIPETYCTVWTNVFERGALKAGEALLVHGGASGIGTTAIALGKAFGAFVIATAGGAARAAACEARGADVGIDYRAEDFVAATMAATSQRGADVILDMVGGDYVERNYAAAALGGRIVQIAFLKGSKATIDLRPLMMKRLVHTGSTLRPRTAEEKGVIIDSLRARVWPLLAAGRCKPAIDSTYPLAAAAAAHARMESSAHFGKIVLTL
jgi:NADPH:quinone reductase